MVKMTKTMCLYWPTLLFWCNKNKVFIEGYYRSMTMLQYQLTLYLLLRAEY